MWIYFRVNDTTYYVGFYTPGGTFNMVEEFESKVEARDMVHFLNGGNLG